MTIKHGIAIYIDDSEVDLSVNFIYNLLHTMTMKFLVKTN